jgi:hypothetical protein
MPAKSKAQARFMGMVHAFKKGEMPGASAAVKRAASGMSDDEAKRFASTKHRGLPDKIRGESMFGQVVAQYNEYGDTLRNSFSMREMAEKLMDIADFAEQTLTNETAGNDWYDAHTIRRNIKEMRAYVKEFHKLAEEYDTIRTRATALYDDMGRVLERYFEVTGYDTDNDMEDDLIPANGEKNPEQRGSHVPQVHETDFSDVGGITEPKSRRDELKKKLRERVVAMARHKLTGEQLVRFDTLDPAKQLRAAWRIVK